MKHNLYLQKALFCSFLSFAVDLLSGNYMDYSFISML